MLDSAAVYVKVNLSAEERVKRHKIVVVNIL